MKRKQSALIFILLACLSALLVVFRKPFMIHLIMKGGDVTEATGILVKWLAIFGSVFFIASVVSLILSWRKKTDTSAGNTYRGRMLRLSLFRHVPFFLAIVTFVYMFLMPSAYKYGNCVFYTDEFPQKIYGDFGTVKYECSRDEYLVGAYDKRNGVEKIFVVSEISKGFYDGLDIIIFDKYGMIESRSQKYSSVVTGPNWREELLQLFAEEQGYMNLFPLSGLSFMK